MTDSEHPQWKQGEPGSVEEKPLPIFCAICGDDATGKHYGSISCDGCKGFFRRSVRRHNFYHCRKSRDCVITKDRRNQCRYCRLRKCFKCGMKREAVQNERDKIRQHRSTEDYSPCLSVTNLRKVDEDTNTYCGYFKGNLHDLRGKRIAELPQVCGGLKLYIFYLLEWASRLPPFNELSPSSKILLCKSKVVQLFILEMAYRSMQANDVIILYDLCFIPRKTDDLEPISGLEMSHIASLMLDELVNPLTDYQVDEIEFACLKSMLFFDPNTRGLLGDSEKVRYCRSQIAANFESYLMERDCNLDKGARGIEELLLLMPLQRIAWQLIDLIQSAILYGQVTVDSLVEEALIGSSGSASERLPRLTPVHF